MELSVKIEGNKAIYKIRGAIDAESGSDLSVKFLEIARDTTIKYADFDLSEVNSITSAGIGKLLKFFKHYDKLGGELKITGISNTLMRQFKEIHLDMIIKIEE